MLVLLPMFVLFSIPILEADQGITISYRSSKALFHTRNKLSEKEKRDKRITQAVLANFAHIVANILNIMQDPENRDNVRVQSSLMVGNIVNMVVQATRHAQVDLPEEEISACIQSLDESFKEQLVTTIIKHSEHMNYKNRIKTAEQLHCYHGTF